MKRKVEYLNVGSSFKALRRKLPTRDSCEEVDLVLIGCFLIFDGSDRLN